MALAEEGAPGAASVRVEVFLDAGAGATDGGSRFRAARARAVIALGRARVPVQGLHRAGRDGEALAAEALDSLAARVADGLTL